MVTRRVAGVHLLDLRLYLRLLDRVSKMIQNRERFLVKKKKLTIHHFKCEIFHLLRSFGSREIPQHLNDFFWVKSASN
jgi:hypothetical protein